MMNNSQVFELSVVQTVWYKPGTNNPILTTFYYSVWTR